MKSYIKIGVSIIFSALAVGMGIYAFLKGEISYDDFKSNTIQEAENIDNNLNDLP